MQRSSRERVALGELPSNHNQANAFLHSLTYAQSLRQHMGIFTEDDADEDCSGYASSVSQAPTPRVSRLNDKLKSFADKARSDSLLKDGSACEGNSATVERNEVGQQPAVGAVGSVERATDCVAAPVLLSLEWSADDQDAVNGVPSLGGDPPGSGDTPVLSVTLRTTSASQGGPGSAASHPDAPGSDGSSGWGRSVPRALQFDSHEARAPTPFFDSPDAAAASPASADASPPPPRLSRGAAVPFRAFSPPDCVDVPSPTFTTSGVALPTPTFPTAPDLAVNALARASSSGASTDEAASIASLHQPATPSVGADSADRSASQSGPPGSGAAPGEPLQDAPSYAGFLQHIAAAEYASPCVGAAARVAESTRGRAPLGAPLPSVPEVRAPAPPAPAGQPADAPKAPSSDVAPAPTVAASVRAAAAAAPAPIELLTPLPGALRRAVGGRCWDDSIVSSRSPGAGPCAPASDGDAYVALVGFLNRPAAARVQPPGAPRRVEDLLLPLGSPFRFAGTNGRAAAEACAPLGSPFIVAEISLAAALPAAPEAGAPHSPPRASVAGASENPFLALAAFLHGAPCQTPIGGQQRSLGALQAVAQGAAPSVGSEFAFAHAPAVATPALFPGGAPPTPNRGFAFPPLQLAVATPAAWDARAGPPTFAFRSDAPGTPAPTPAFPGGARAPVNGFSFVAPGTPGPTPALAAAFGVEAAVEVCVGPRGMAVRPFGELCALVQDRADVVVALPAAKLAWRLLAEQRGQAQERHALPLTPVVAARSPDQPVAPQTPPFAKLMKFLDPERDAAVESALHDAEGGASTPTAAEVPQQPAEAPATPGTRPFSKLLSYLNAPPAQGGPKAEGAHAAPAASPNFVLNALPAVATASPPAAARSQVEASSGGHTAAVDDEEDAPDPDLESTPLFAAVEPPASPADAELQPDAPEGGSSSPLVGAPLADGPASLPVLAAAERPEERVQGSPHADYSALASSASAGLPEPAQAPPPAGSAHQVASPEEPPCVAAAQTAATPAAVACTAAAEPVAAGGAAPGDDDALLTHAREAAAALTRSLPPPPPAHPCRFSLSSIPRRSTAAPTPRTSLQALPPTALARAPRATPLPSPAASPAKPTAAAEHSAGGRADATPTSKNKRGLDAPPSSIGASAETSTTPSPSPDASARRYKWRTGRKGLWQKRASPDSKPRKKARASLRGERENAAPDSARSKLPLPTYLSTTARPALRPVQPTGLSWVPSLKSSDSEAAAREGQPSSDPLGLEPCRKACPKAPPAERVQASADAALESPRAPAELTAGDETPPAAAEGDLQRRSCEGVLSRGCSGSLAAVGVELAVCSGEAQSVAVSLAMRAGRSLDAMYALPVGDASESLCLHGGLCLESSPLKRVPGQAEAAFIGAADGESLCMHGGRCLEVSPLKRVPGQSEAAFVGAVEGESLCMHGGRCLESSPLKQHEQLPTALPCTESAEFCVHGGKDAAAPKTDGCASPRSVLSLHQWPARCDQLESAPPLADDAARRSELASNLAASEVAADGVRGDRPLAEASPVDQQSPSDGVSAQELGFLLASGGGDADDNDESCASDALDGCDLVVSAVDGEPRVARASAASPPSLRDAACAPASPSAASPAAIAPLEPRASSPPPFAASPPSSLSSPDSAVRGDALRESLASCAFGGEAPWSPCSVAPPAVAPALLCQTPPASPRTRSPALYGSGALRAFGSTTGTSAPSPASSRGALTPEKSMSPQICGNRSVGGKPPAPRFCDGLSESAAALQNPRTPVLLLGSRGPPPTPVLAHVAALKASLRSSRATSMRCALSPQLATPQCSHMVSAIDEAMAAGASTPATVEQMPAADPVRTWMEAAGLVDVATPARLALGRLWSAAEEGAALQAQLDRFKALELDMAESMAEEHSREIRALVEDYRQLQSEKVAAEMRVEQLSDEKDHLAAQFESLVARVHELTARLAAHHPPGGLSPPVRSLPQPCVAPGPDLTTSATAFYLDSTVRLDESVLCLPGLTPGATSEARPRVFAALASPVPHARLLACVADAAAHAGVDAAPFLLMARRLAALRTFCVDAAPGADGGVLCSHGRPELSVRRHAAGKAAQLLRLVVDTLCELNELHGGTMADRMRVREAYKAASDALRALPRADPEAVAPAAALERSAARDALFDLDLQLEAVCVSSRQHLERFAAEERALAAQVGGALPPAEALALEGALAAAAADEGSGGDCASVTGEVPAAPTPATAAEDGFGAILQTVERLSATAQHVKRAHSRSAQPSVHGSPVPAATAAPTGDSPTLPLSAQLANMALQAKLFLEAYEQQNAGMTARAPDGPSAAQPLDRQRQHTPTPAPETVLREQLCDVRAPKDTPPPTTSLASTPSALGTPLQSPYSAGLTNVTLTPPSLAYNSYFGAAKPPASGQRSAARRLLGSASKADGRRAATASFAFSPPRAALHRGDPPPRAFSLAADLSPACGAAASPPPAFTPNPLYDAPFAPSPVSLISPISDLRAGRRVLRGGDASGAVALGALDLNSALADDDDAVVLSTRSEPSTLLRPLPTAGCGKRLLLATSASHDDPLLGDTRRDGLTRQSHELALSDAGRNRVRPGALATDADARLRFIGRALGVSVSPFIRPAPRSRRLVVSRCADPGADSPEADGPQV